MLTDQGKKRKKARRSNALARASSEKLAKSVWEERIIIRLLCQLTGQEKNFPVLSVPASELGLDCNSGETYKNIKKACHNLLSTVKMIEAPDRKSFKGFPYFQEIDYKSGIIKAQFNNKIKPHLLGLKAGYTETDYEQFRKLTSINGQILYDLLRSWRDRKETPILALDRLHDLFSSTKYQRTHWKNFRQKTLDPAIADVKNTGLWFETKFIKQGRSIAGVQFILALDAKIELQKKEKRTQQDDNNKLFRDVFTCVSEHLLLDCKPNMRTKTCKFCLENNMRGQKNKQDSNFHYTEEE